MPTRVQHPAHATTAQFFLAADSAHQSQGTDGLGITRTRSLGASEQRGLTVEGWYSHHAGLWLPGRHPGKEESRVFREVTSDMDQRYGCLK